MLINLVDMVRKSKAPDTEATLVSKLPHLAAWRKYRKINQTTLARATGYTQGMISQWQRGKSDVPLGAVEKLARALDITPLQLIFFPPGEETIYDIWERLPPDERPRAMRLLKNLPDPGE
jgi:transcriptional regulator with XRE-family HTH domain